MPDERYEEAVRQVVELLGQFNHARALTVRQLSAYPKRFVQGWEIPGLCGDSDYNLRLLVTKGFPFCPPRVAVSPAPPVLTWPNLEEDGLLCLLPESAHVSISDPKSVVLSLLDDAQGLIRANIAGDGLERFEDEFHSYWIRWDKTKALMSLLCHPKGPSRWVSAWHGKNYTLVAENMEELRSWLRNRYGENTAKKAEFQSVPLIWLPRPPHPSEYPATVSALMSLLRSNGVDQEMVRELLLDEQASYKTVVLGFDGRHGPGFAGIRIHEPKSARHSGNALMKGFRSRPPDRVLLTRYSACQIVGARVVRYDASWVHGRDHNDDVFALGDKSVVVVGCGSLGSTVVELIAKAGVGKITIIDHDFLGSENVGRHALGVSAVGLRKADEMARDLATRFPHLTIEGYAEPFERFPEDKLEQLYSADLIISATGSWQVESLLNSVFCESEQFPPVLSGWLEPHAAAGHAIVVFKGQGCLRCLMDDLGNIRFPVTEWEDKHTMLSIPSCGGLFQPYGAVELTHVHALVADLSLDVLLGRVDGSTHRVWLGHKKLLDRAGGKWNSAWADHHGNPGSGSSLLDVTIERDPECPECGGLG